MFCEEDFTPRQMKVAAAGGELELGRQTEIRVQIIHVKW